MKTPVNVELQTFPALEEIIFYTINEKEFCFYSSVTHGCDMELAIARIL